MKTAETINNVCTEIGITKADLAKRMGMLPSSLYRKLARESMTFEELQRCLDVLGVTIEFQLRYPDGSAQSSQVNYEMLLKRMDILEAELETARKKSEFHKKSLKELRTELSNVVGYAELGRKDHTRAEEYLGKIRLVLTNMELAIACALGEIENGEGDDGEADTEEPADIQLLSGKRVLLVDDNELNRETMREILLNHSLVVEEAANGRTALETLNAKEPGYYDYVLMDLEMPEMDGYEATTRIRRLPNRIRANVPIIALTANAFPEDRERALDAGMDDFLAKPVNSGRLLRSLVKFR